MESVILFVYSYSWRDGSIPGVILGSAGMMVLPELLRNFAQYRMLFFGLALVLMMISVRKACGPADAGRQSLGRGRANEIARTSPTQTQ